MTTPTIQQLQRDVALHRHEPSYKQLFVFFYGMLLRYANRLVTSSEEAEELVSDVMLKVWTMEGKLLQVENLKVYLYKAVRNTAINLLAKRARIGQFVPVDGLDDSLQTNTYNPEQAILQAEQTTFLKKVIAALPGKCRTVYELVREDGLSYKEVASILNISENTVDRHLSNALHKLAGTINFYFDRKRVAEKKVVKVMGSSSKTPVLPMLPMLNTAAI